MKLFRGVPAAEMLGQRRLIQANFSCTLPVPETGYSCMGSGGLHASWLRTEVLAAMARLGPVPEPGYGVCTINTFSICTLFWISAPS